MGFHLKQYSQRKWPKLCLVWSMVTLAALLSACLQADPAPSPQPATAKPNETQALPTTSIATPFQPLDTPPPAKATQNPTQTVQTTNLIGITPGVLQGQTIQFWHAGSREAGQVWDNLAEEFNASNEWGIRVQATEVGNYDELDSRMEMALQSSAPPDLVTALTYQAAAWGARGDSQVQRSNGGEDPAEGTSTATAVLTSTSTVTATTPVISQANSIELLTNLKDYVNDPTWGLKPDEQADFYPVFWEADVMDGKRLGLPAIRSAQVLYYNQTWARELGFQEPPATPEQFQEQACAAAQANKVDDDPENDGTGGWIISTQPTTAAGWLESYGSDFIDEHGYRFDTPQVEAAFRFLRSLYDSGCAWLLPENASPESDFADRRGLFATGSLADLPDQSAAMERAGNGDRWTLLAFPSPDEDPAISALGPSYVILKTTPERQLAAWLFARWLSQPERQAALALASGSLPTRRSATEQLSALSSSTGQWHTALNLIEFARPEPPFASWTTVRWALGDAATQLFRYYFTADGIPSLVQLLDETAQELHDRQ